MVETISDYVDRVVEEVVTAYAQAREGWVRDHSAVLAMQVRDLLRRDPRDVAAIERTLDYRMDRHHVGLVIWTDEPDNSDALARIRKLVSSVVESIGADGPLVVPVDESRAWAWVPTKTSQARSQALAAAMKEESLLSLAVGQPGPGVDGFRRTHQQAVSAQSVALAAGDQHAPLTPFVDVAPIAMLTATWSRPARGSTKRLATSPSTRAAKRVCARRYRYSSRPAAATWRPPKSSFSTATRPSTESAEPRRYGADLYGMGAWTWSWRCWPANG
jgi:hypothetical protein